MNGNAKGAVQEYRMNGMANRFTDTDKWKKVWFRSLSSVHKSFWTYVCDNCNHAGIWEVDFGLAEFMVGSPLNEPEIRQQFQKQYVELNGGKRWFLTDFVGFQYGVLRPEVQCHKSVLKLLQPYWELVNPYIRVEQGLGKGLATLKDKDKDKDKDKYKDYVYLSKEEYKKLADNMGVSETEAYIDRLNNYIGSKGKQYKSHYHTILNWVAKDQKEDKGGRPKKHAQRDSGKYEGISEVAE